MNLGAPIAIAFWLGVAWLGSRWLRDTISRAWDSFMFLFDERRALAQIAASQPLDVPLDELDRELYWDADECEREFWAAAERYRAGCELEQAFALPCAPNPKLRYSNGTTERRLVQQRKREQAH